MKRMAYIAIMMSIVIMFGCSNAVDTALTPSTNIDNPVATESNGTGMLGIYDVHVNGNTLTAEMNPMRNPTLTDVFEVVDITGFLTASPCRDCAKIFSVGLNPSNNLILRIGIKHPFEAGDPSQPITGRNRADLHVFNAEGIVIANTGVPMNFVRLKETIGPRILTNPDGFTRYLDSYFDTIFPTDATIHPYILHFNNYGTGNFAATNPMGFASVTDPPPSGNLVVPMGAPYDIKDYILSTVAGTQIDFYFAIGCSYGISTNTFEDRFNPQFRVPQYNKKAASEVDVEIASSNLAAGITQSKATLNVKVLDINHGVAVGPGLDQMYADSSVKGIGVEVPGVTLAPAIVYNPVAIQGDGRDPLNPLIFQIKVPNSAGAGVGTYTGLVKVLDSYPVAQNTHPLIGTNDGVHRVPPMTNPLEGLFAIPEFATYQLFDITVAETPSSPIVTVHANPEQGDAPLSVDFTVDVILVPLTTIQSYSWTFGDTGTSSEQNPSHVYNSEGIYIAKCIVTDSNMNTGDDTIQITVNIPPPSYVGSATCSTCHSARYNEWQKHGHHFILNKVASAAPTYPFSSVPNPPSGLTWGNITYVIGGYANKANFMDSDGKIILGPDVQYNLASHQFVQYESPSRTVKDYDCGKCHSTGWQSFADNGGVHQDNLVGIMGTWAEAGVGCEACHGKGSKHAASQNPADITKDPSAASCGVCHSREPVDKILVKNALVLNNQQYSQLLRSPHSGLNCVDCHSSHAGTMYDSSAPGTGVIALCTQCHDAATHKVSGAMSSLKCTDCHMPLGAYSAEYHGSATHITGDMHNHIWAIDVTGIKLSDYFSTDGSQTWITPDGVTGKVKLNLAYACMQCHDGVHEFEITSYTTCKNTAAGIHQ